ncbi:MAG TPA: ComF family protein [Candidatus Binataceae bacterium]|nr:ComF family protein [Candidatus Binataceae bacterium]
MELTSQTRDLFTTLRRELLNFLLPFRCAGCAIFMPAHSPHRLCPTCLGILQRPQAPLCQACGLPLGSGPPLELCVRCSKDRPGFGKARALFCYASSSASQPDILGSVIRRHKYGPNQALGAVLAGLLEEGLPVDPDYDVVIPVPLHRRRLLSRGFNQSALLAAAVTRKLRCRLDVASLVRVIATPPQTAQDLESRRRNVHNAFAVRYPERVAGLKVLLIDDVLTTGSTANECARALRAAGADTVDVLTIARVL